MNAGSDPTYEAWKPAFTAFLNTFAIPRSDPTYEAWKQILVET